MRNLEKRLPENNPGGGDLKWVSTCPLCGKEYAPEEARIVSEKEGAFLVHTNCKRCGSSVVATLVANQLGISSVGLITDLTYEDVVKFKDGENISTDDLLSLYEILNNKPNFEKLFAL